MHRNGNAFPNNESFFKVFKRVGIFHLLLNSAPTRLDTSRNSYLNTCDSIKSAQFYQNYVEKSQIYLNEVLWTYTSIIGLRHTVTDSMCGGEDLEKIVVTSAIYWPLNSLKIIIINSLKIIVIFQKCWFIVLEIPCN